MTQAATVEHEEETLSYWLEMLSHHARNTYQDPDTARLAEKLLREIDPTWQPPVFEGGARQSWQPLVDAFLEVKAAHGEPIEQPKLVGLPRVAGSVLAVARRAIYLGNFSVAERLAEYAIQRAPENSRLKMDTEKGDGYFVLAECNIKAGKIHEAIYPARKAADSLPNSPNASRLLAEAYSKIGNYGEAVTALKQAAKIDPDNYDIAAELGIALARGGRHKEAVKHLEKGANSNRDLKYLGRSLVEVKDFDRAYHIYHRVLGLHSKDLEIADYFALAATSSAIGGGFQINQAKSFLQRAQRMAVAQGDGPAEAQAMVSYARLGKSEMGQRMGLDI